MQRNPSVEERFWSRVRQTDTCWVWVAGKSRLGYGRFWNGVREVKAHRFAYELLVGPVPDGLVLDHLCRNTFCVNPAHLEPVTNGENVLRGYGPPAKRARQTHCKRGHPLSGDNLRIDWQGYRQCVACDRDRAKRAWRKRAGTSERTAFLLERLRDAGALSPETAQPLGNVLPAEQNPRHWSGTCSLLEDEGLLRRALPAEPVRRWWSSDFTRAKDDLGSGWYVVEAA